MTNISLFSSSLEWNWKIDDDNVKYFRYQLNGEDENNWTTLDSSVTSITLDKTTDSDTLFIQASYDGDNWSPSGVGRYIEKEDGKNKDKLLWSWEKTDEDIKYYRYQLNSTDDDDWTTVDGDTTSVTLEKETDSDTFYIEASYDKVHWSDSTSFTYREEKKKETKIPLSLRFNIAPYSGGVYFFYNGHYINKARTLMGTIYGVSTSLEVDITPVSFLRFYTEAGYAYVLKIMTEIPKQQDMQYIKAGVGIDGIINVTEKTDIYIGALGGVMMHINYDKYNVAPYYGARTGLDTKINDYITLGGFTRVTASFLEVDDDTLYSSATLLVDPVSLVLTYSF